MKGGLEDFWFGKLAQGKPQIKDAGVDFFFCGRMASDSSKSVSCRRVKGATTASWTCYFLTGNPQGKTGTLFVRVLAHLHSVAETWVSCMPSEEWILFKA